MRKTIALALMILLPLAVFADVRNPVTDAQTLGGETASQLKDRANHTGVDDAMLLLDGLSKGRPGFQVTSDGATVTIITTNISTDALGYYFDGTLVEYTLPATNTLSAGTTTSAQQNWLYATPSNITAGTSRPQNESSVMAIINLLDAATTQTDGPLTIQRYTKTISEPNSMGRVMHHGDRIRIDGAKWDTGMAPSTVVVTNGAADDDVFIEITSGTADQMHNQSAPALTEVGQPFYILNDTNGITTITNLNQITHDADGNAVLDVNNSWFNVQLVEFVGSGSDDATNAIMLTLSTDDYSDADNAANDSSNYSVNTVDPQFQGGAIWIATITLRRQSTGGGTWTATVINRRGLDLGTTGSGSGSGISPSTFQDASFAVIDDADPTKVAKIECSDITSAQTRTLWYPDASGTNVITPAPLDLDMNNNSITNGDNIASGHFNGIPMSRRGDPDSIYIGTNTGQNVTGSNNRSTVIGDNAATNATTISDVTSIGYQNARTATTLDSCTLLGDRVAPLAPSISESDIHGNEACISVTGAITQSQISGNRALAASTAPYVSRVYADGYYSMHDASVAEDNSFSGPQSGQHNGGIGNSGFGDSVLRENRQGTNSVGGGKDAGRYASDGNNATNLNECGFFGADSRPLLGAAENEWVIGSYGRGHGSNTFTIGNSNITANYFSGDIIVSDRSIIEPETPTPYGVDNTSFAGYWSCNGNTKDFSGLGKDGTLVGNTDYSDGVFGRGLEFAGGGSGDRMTLPVTAMAVTNGSIAHWIKSDSTNTQQVIAYTWGGTGDFNGFGHSGDQLEIHTSIMDDGTAFLQYQNGTNNVQIKGGTISMEGWQHMVATYDIAGFVRLYLDGVEVASSNVSALVFSTNSQTGSQIGAPAVGSRQFDGELDEVMYFDRVLSSNEVVSLYASGKQFTLSGSDFTYFDGTRVRIEANESRTALISPDGTDTLAVSNATVYIEESLVVGSTASASDPVADSDLTTKSWVTDHSSTNSYWELSGTTLSNRSDIGATALIFHDDTRNRMRIDPDIIRFDSEGETNRVVIDDDKTDIVGEFHVHNVNGSTDRLLFDSVQTIVYGENGVINHTLNNNIWVYTDNNVPRLEVYPTYLALYAEEQNWQVRLEEFVFQVNDGITDRIDIDTTKIDLVSSNAATKVTITDTGIQHTGQVHQNAINAITYSGTNATFDCANGNYQSIVVTNNPVITFTNVQPGSYSLVIEQDAAGSRTPTWSTQVGFDSGGVPSTSTTAGHKDLFFFMGTGTNTLFGTKAGNGGWQM